MILLNSRTRCMTLDSVRTRRKRVGKYQATKEFFISAISYYIIKLDKFINKRGRNTIEKKKETKIQYRAVCLVNRATFR